VTPVNENLEWPDNKENRHCYQATEVLVADAELVAKDRVLAADAPKLPYRRRKYDMKSVIHWGQRKLLLSEIEFLTNYGHPESDIVYAGAAPGIHIPYLAGLFPDNKWILIDPAKFCEEVNRHERISARQEFFTDATCKEFAGKQVLFISDIRSANPSKQKWQEVEHQVKEDMDAQKRWHELMKPLKSILKFRLPWDPGSTSYLDGLIYLPVWGPQTTSEARLVPTSGTKDYDHTDYEQQMFCFNTVSRVKWYPHKVQGEGIDHCFDCASEIFVLKQFIDKFKPCASEKELLDKIATMSREISRVLSPDRTLESNPYGYISDD